MIGKDNYSVMQNFDLEHIPNLDVCVFGALEFLSDFKLPEIKVPKRERILVIGSGNALAVGRIIFRDRDAVFASESDYRERLEVGEFDLIVLISASGGKSAVGIAKYLKRRRKRVLLLTNNSDAYIAKFVSDTLVFPKQREPYTYNTSTYLSMILAATGESPESIYNFVLKVGNGIPGGFSKYDAFYFVVPDKFDTIRELFVTKFDELFGSEVMGRVFTWDQTKHAKTVVSSDKELFVGMGLKNKVFGEERFNIEFPKGFGFGMMMCVGYYLIGKIQNGKEAFFAENIVGYAEEASKVFDEEIKPIVEGGGDERESAR